MNGLVETRTRNLKIDLNCSLEYGVRDRLTGKYPKVSASFNKRPRLLQYHRH
jgi:hypothetical protein